MAMMTDESEAEIMRLYPDDERCVLLPLPDDASPAHERLEVFTSARRPTFASISTTHRFLTTGHDAPSSEACIPPAACLYSGV
jgi:hypothetical protein